MKIIIKISMTIALFFANNMLIAQAPDGFNYQAVIRDSAGEIVSNTDVNIRFSILDDLTLGNILYRETQNLTTNEYGMVNHVIGFGNFDLGNFSELNWTIGDKFLKVEVSLNNGPYNDLGTQQLMSVPYALHAKTAESVTGGSSNDFYLGQDTLGGIVFYIYIGIDGNQHGLIVNKNESTAQWQSSGTTTNATRCWDGFYNTGLMTSSPTATYVNGLTDGGFTDWYLPSIDELSILWHNRFHTNNALNAGGFTLLANADKAYWSSTEYDASSALRFSFTGGSTSFTFKTGTYSVRAVRAF